jgi:hypothetical protein
VNEFGRPAVAVYALFSWPGAGWLPKGLEGVVAEISSQDKTGLRISGFLEIKVGTVDTVFGSAVSGHDR